MSEEICLSLVTFAISHFNGEMGTCHVFNLSLCIVHYGGLLKKSIHSHILGVTFFVMLFLFHFCHDYADYLSNILIELW